LQKLDANGFPQWSGTFRGEYDDNGRACIETEKGDFAVAGMTKLAEDDPHPWGLLLNAEGELIWRGCHGQFPLVQRVIFRISGPSSRMS